MAGIRFRGEFRTSTNVLYTVDIYDTEFSGTLKAFKLGAQGFRLQYRGENNNMFTPIVGSELEFDMMIEDADHEQFITDIAASPESRFWIGVYKGVGGQDLWWCGIVTPDIARSEDAAYPFAFSVRAVDGLGLLRTLDYSSDEGLAVTGTERIMTIIQRCLNYLPHISHYYEQSDNFINTSVNWYEDSHSYTTTYDPLYHTYANNFVTSSADDQALWYDENNFEYLTVYEVLASILTIFGARITHYGGVFYIEQIETRTADTFYSRRYSYPIGSPVAIDLQGTISIAQGQTRRKLNGGTFTWFPSLRKATIKYKTKNRRNFWPPFRWGFKGGYGLNDYIERDTGIDINIKFPQQFIFNGNLRFTINSASYATSQIAVGSSYLIVAYIGVIVEDSPTTGKALLRQATDNGFSIVYGQTSWDNSLNSRYAFAGSFFKMPGTGDPPLSMNIPISFTTPHIAGTLGAVAGRLKLSFTVGLYGPDADDNYEFKFLNPDLMQDYNWALQNPYMELTAAGFQNTSTNEKIYTISSDVVGSTAEYEATVYWADGDTENTVGRLQTESGGVYTDTDAWGVKTTSGTQLLQELLLERMMRMQRNPVMKYDGTIYGPDFAIYKVLVDTQSRKWMFLGGAYTANRDEWQGEWANIGVYSSGTFEIVSTEGEMFPGGYYPAGPVVDTSTESIVPGNIAPATLEPLAAAVVAVSYPSGSAPGSGVSVNSVLGAGAFVQGQQIAIVNPSSGQFAYFEVTSDTAAGDTAIAISGSFPSRFPAGSYIINLPSNYTVSGGVGPSQGGGGGGGTVTSVGLTMPAIFNVTGSPVTASGDIGVTLNTQTQRLFLASPSGSTGVPTFRAIVAQDVPTLNQNTTGTAANVIGTVAIANGGTGATTASGARSNLGATTVGSSFFTVANPSAIRFPRINANNTVTLRTAADFRGDIGAGAGSGTVTSVGLVAPLPFFVEDGTFVTGSGNLEFKITDQVQKTFYSGPVSGANAAPAFRTIVAGDLPNISNLNGTLNYTKLETTNADADEVLRYNGTEWEPSADRWSASGAAISRTSAVIINGAASVGTTNTNNSQLTLFGNKNDISLGIDTSTLSANGKAVDITGSVTGKAYGFYINMSVNTDILECLIRNSSNASTSNSTLLNITSRSGDAMLRLAVDNGDFWQIINDNSDDDCFVITKNGGPNVNQPFKIATNGVTTIRQLAAKTATLSMTALAAAGVSPSSISASGSETFFIAGLVTGTSTTTGDFFSVTLALSFPTTCIPILYPGNAKTAEHWNYFHWQSSTNNSFTIRARVAPDASTAYSFNIMVGGY
jgi:hypothetical protein